MASATSLHVQPHAERDIVMTRTFDAPRTRVFDAWTNPQMLKRWMGGKGFKLETCDVDLRVGGKWRFVMKSPGKPDISMGGIYKEIKKPERIAATKTSDRSKGEAMLTTTFTEQGGRTLISHSVRYGSTKDRDEAMGSQMGEVMRESFDRLEKLLGEKMVH